MFNQTSEDKEPLWKYILLFPFKLFLVIVCIILVTFSTFLFIFDMIVDDFRTKKLNQPVVKIRKRNEKRKK
jgi:hypothetical protein